MIHFFPSRPVFLEIFGFSVHWYGIMYLLAFLIAWYLLPRLQKRRGLTLGSDEWSAILSWAIVGVIAGGRLGYVLFYEPSYFALHPTEVFAVWHGGMSSHGGFIGVTLALLYALRHRKQDFLRIADIVVIPVAIGLALGRMGNFINQELYGRITTLPWCIMIPGVEGCRHPAQLYAVAKDLFIAAACFWYLSRVTPIRPGRTAALFLMLYGTLRFLVEFVREPDHSPFSVLGLVLTRGQLYSLPILIAGIVLWWWTARKRSP
jgi:phosphatidylglycerol:prolipoprotein diacylglycerol transferase